jgi:hypothetical protein
VAPQERLAFQNFTTAVIGASKLRGQTISIIVSREGRYACELLRMAGKFQLLRRQLGQGPRSALFGESNEPVATA